MTRAEIAEATKLGLWFVFRPKSLESYTGIMRNAWQRFTLGFAVAKLPSWEDHNA